MIIIHDESTPNKDDIQFLFLAFSRFVCLFFSIWLYVCLLFYIKRYMKTSNQIEQKQNRSRTDEKREMLWDYSRKPRKQSEQKSYFSFVEEQINCFIFLSPLTQTLQLKQRLRKRKFSRECVKKIALRGGNFETWLQADARAMQSWGAASDSEWQRLIYPTVSWLSGRDDNAELGCS